jgi:molybdopterin biosynthesis enzyme
LSQANFFIVVPADAANVEAGTQVDVQPLEGLL